MKNTFTTPSDFWQERDFGAKISASFEFIGAHWRTLGKALVYFVVPVGLVLGIGLGFFSNSVYNLLGAQRHGAPFSSPMSSFGLISFGGMAVAVLFGLLAFLLLSGTLYGYVRARLRLPPTEPVTPAEVWVELRARLGRMVLAGLLLLGLGGLSFGLVFGLLMGASVGVAGVLGPFLAVFVLMLPAAYVSVTLGLYLPVLWFEDLSIIASVGRCFQLIRGRWWATLGLMLVAGFIHSLLTYVFAIPQYVILFGKALQLPSLDSDVLGLVAASIYALGAVLTYVLPLLALVFQYFHLAEQKEGHGLRLLVDQLGQPQAAPLAESGHYQPDEEGEY